MMAHGFDMAGYGLTHWTTSVVMAVASLYPIGRILIWIRLSPFWVILVLVPFFNLIGLWVLASVEWPRQGSGRPGQSDVMKSFNCPDGTVVRKAIPSLVSVCLVAFATICMVGGAWAGEPDGRTLVDRADTLLWGKTLQGEFQMTITIPRWQCALDLRARMERPRHSSIRVPASVKEAGIGSLRIGSGMWNYLPNIERTTKTPPSVMLQPWTGSDFTNDDLVKQSSAMDDYMHRVLRTEALNDAASYVIESTPKPDVVAVWGKTLYWIRQVDTVPLKQHRYSKRNELMRVLMFSDVGLMDSRTIPTKWEMRPVNDSGHTIVIVVKAARYDQSIDDERFTQRNLRKP